MCCRHTFGLLLAALCLSTAATAQDDAPADYGTGHPGFEAALGYAIPFSKAIVARGDTLIPFGLAITAPGVPNVVQAWDDALTGQELLLLTVESMRTMAQTGVGAEGAPTRPLIASALVLDILTDVPGRPGKTDAIAVILEAPDVPEAQAYVLPYVRDGEGGIEYLEPYARPEASVLIPR